MNSNKSIKAALIGIAILVAFIVMIGGIFVSTNNRAISLEEQVLSAESNIQVQEKRRTDLIYNLADCVKQYDSHEAETLIGVVEAREDGGDADVENISIQIKALAEAYPELKSNENYKELMNELAITENKIAEYRNAYNNEVRSYNKYVKKLPNNQILSTMGYEIVNYTYLEYNEEETAPITNLFGE